MILVIGTAIIPVILTGMRTVLNSSDDTDTVIIMEIKTLIMIIVIRRILVGQKIIHILQSVK